jgi:tetratricopeptide (TPR) repeat protein
MMGEAYFKLDRVKEAEYWYREALRVKPDHIPAHLTYGKLLAKLVISFPKQNKKYANCSLILWNCVCVCVFRIA